MPLPACSRRMELEAVTGTDSGISATPRARRDARRWWIALQVALIVPFLWVAAVAIEMTFAMPGKGYRDASGRYVACEALAARGRPHVAPRCAAYGSIETNPSGFATVVSTLAALSWVLWASTRPGRGLRFHARRGSTET